MSATALAAKGTGTIKTKCEIQSAVETTYLSDRHEAYICSKGSQWTSCYAYDEFVDTLRVDDGSWDEGAVRDAWMREWAERCNVDDSLCSFTRDARKHYAKHIHTEGQ